MAFIQFLQSFSNPALDLVFEFITMLGEEHFFVILFCTIFWCYDKRLGYRLGFAYGTSGVLNNWLKELFRTPRPIGLPQIRSVRVESAPGFSFPSGHTQAITTLVVYLMDYFREKWLFALGTIIIVLVGVSRLYLGLHFPIDIVGGLIFGAAWVFVANSIFDWMTRIMTAWSVLVVALPVLVGVFFLRSYESYQLAGIMLGLLVGYFVESRSIHFEEKASMWVQIVKLVLGVTGILVIRASVKILLPAVPQSDALRYFLVAVWITVIFPAFFTHLIPKRSDTSLHR